ncbi:MAG: DUF1624 domain-containing protein [Oscillospiraceae bacterium]|nr:DUF1624 domain-containing protein [Oscillospiraceae bacterium]
MKRERYHLLDGLRGLLVVNMVLFHFMYDLCIIQGFDRHWYWRPASRVWQMAICCGFLLLSGLCFHLGSRRVKSGLIINLCGLIVTAVTVAVMPDQAVWFGVLNCLGCSLLLASALEPALKKVDWRLGASGSAFLFLLTYRIDQGLLGIGNWVMVRLPESWYQTSWLAPLGFPGPEFTSSDYFPLLPWFFLYLTGYFLGRVVLEKSSALLGRKLPVLDWIGRHSLVVYMIHQPVCMVLSMGAALLLK